MAPTPPSSSALTPHRPGRPGPVWMDAGEYLRKKLLDGQAVPWEDSGPFASYVQRGVSLLESDAALLDLVAAWSLHPVEVTQTRRARALRTLLDDPTNAAVALEALRTAAAAVRVPVVAVLASPRRWLMIANYLAGTSDTPIDEDSVDAAAMYIAGVVPAIADTGAACLLIDEADSAAEDLTPVSAVQTITNAATHHGLAVVVRSHVAPCWALAHERVAAWVGPRPPEIDGAPPWSVCGELGRDLPAAEGGGSPHRARFRG